MWPVGMVVIFPLAWYTRLGCYMGERSMLYRLLGWEKLGRCINGMSWAILAGDLLLNNLFKGMNFRSA